MRRCLEMRKVMHIADLHFGRADPAVAMALREIEQRLSPHPVGRAAMAMASLREYMPDLLLAGHVHLHGWGRQPNVTISGP